VPVLGGPREKIVDNGRIDGSSSHPEPRYFPSGSFAAKLGGARRVRRRVLQRITGHSRPAASYPIFWRFRVSWSRPGSSALDVTVSAVSLLLAPVLGSRPHHRLNPQAILFREGVGQGGRPFYVCQASSMPHRAEETAPCSAGRTTVRSTRMGRILPGPLDGAPALERAGQEMSLVGRGPAPEVHRSLSEHTR
jgi:hypothetical protein